MKVINTDTDVKPWDVGVHASRTSYVAGNSAIMAATQARDEAAARGRARRIKLDRLDARPGGRLHRAGRREAWSRSTRMVRNLHFPDKGELLVTHAYFEPASVKQDKAFRGNVSPTYAFGTHVVEVEVELDTGIVRVLGVWAAHDVGRVLNALGSRGRSRAAW